MGYEYDENTLYMCVYETVKEKTTQTQSLKKKVRGFHKAKEGRAGTRIESSKVVGLMQVLQKRVGPPNRHGTIVSS